MYNNLRHNSFTTHQSLEGKAKRQGRTPRPMQEDRAVELIND